jgi:hypothetical protein
VISEKHKCRRKKISNKKYNIMIVSGKRFQEPVIDSPDRVIVDPDVSMKVPIYFLNEADYLTLTSKGPSGLFEALAYGSFGVFVGHLITIMAKYYEGFTSKTEVKIDSLEKNVLVISLILSFLCWLGKFLPNGKRKLLKKIRQHLESKQKIVEARSKIET